MISKSEDLRITTAIMEIAVEKNKETQALLSKAVPLVNYEKGEILLIIQGEQSIKLIFNDKNKNKILSLFSKKSILVIQENLAEINIHLSEEAVKTPGILVVLTTELMMHNINIVETMSCVPEMLFFVHQKDIVKSYELLFKLCKA